MANINDKIIEGGDLMLFIGGKSIAFATSHSLSISAETAETTSKDNGGMWVSKAIRKISWTMNTENLYSIDGEGNNYDTLFDAMVNKTFLTAVFATKGIDANDVPEGGWTAKADQGYTGSVVVTSLELNAANGENATFTASFEGVGELKKVNGSTSGGTTGGNTGGDDDELDPLG